MAEAQNLLAAEQLAKDLTTDERVKLFHALVAQVVGGKSSVYNAPGELHSSMDLAVDLYEVLAQRLTVNCHRPDGYLFLKCLKTAREFFAENAGVFHADSYFDNAGYGYLRVLDQFRSKSLNSDDDTFRSYLDSAAMAVLGAMAAREDTLKDLWSQWPDVKEQVFTLMADHLGYICEFPEGELELRPKQSEGFITFTEAAPMTGEEVLEKMNEVIAKVREHSGGQDYFSIQDYKEARIGQGLFNDESPATTLQGAGFNLADPTPEELHDILVKEFWVAGLTASSGMLDNLVTWEEFKAVFDDAIPKKGLVKQPDMELTVEWPEAKFFRDRAACHRHGGETGKYAADFAIAAYLESMRRHGVLVGYLLEKPRGPSEKPVTTANAGVLPARLLHKQVKICDDLTKVAMVHRGKVDQILEHRPNPHEALDGLAYQYRVGSHGWFTEDCFTVIPEAEAEEATYSC